MPKLVNLLDVPVGEFFSNFDPYSGECIFIKVRISNNKFKASHTVKSWVPIKFERYDGVVQEISLRGAIWNVFLLDSRDLQKLVE